MEHWSLEGWTYCPYTCTKLTITLQMWRSDTLLNIMSYLLLVWYIKARRCILEKKNQNTEMIPFHSHCKWDLCHMPSFLDSSQVYGHLGCVNQERNTFRRGISKDQYRQWVSMVSGEMWRILGFELQGQIHRNFKFFVVHSEACRKWQDLCIFQVALKILERFSKENEIYIKVVLLPTFNDKVFSGLKVILRSS